MLPSLLLLLAVPTTPTGVSGGNSSECHTATPDDACFVHAQWAHSIGLKAPRGMNMLKNKGARNLGLACIHHTGYTDGPDVLVQCDYDVGGHDWD